MCGIFCLLNEDGQIDNQIIKESFYKGKHRGPEHSSINNTMVKCLFGFHRLAINGLNEESNQPIRIGDITLICNGEIYNYKQLYNFMNYDCEVMTDSDCEVIIHLYIRYGIEQTLRMLDGVFAFVLLDSRIHNEQSKVYVARDPYGVRPLFYLKPKYKQHISKKNNSLANFNKGTLFGFSSELKTLYSVCETFNTKHKDTEHKNVLEYNIKQFAPGTYSLFTLSYKVQSNWELEKRTLRYHNFSFYDSLYTDSSLCVDQNILQNLRKYLKKAVVKRCVTSDRPIACLLSGGLDSSLIAALVNDYHIENGLPPLETYSIGLKDSEDLKYAKIVANHLQTKHTEVIIEEKDFFNNIENVIKDIESFDTTTIRASIGNWLIGKYISENSDAKVIFNGDGADELMGGYLYMGHADDCIEFDKECKRLLTNICYFDVLRSDRCISSHGLEPRTPFLDKYFTQYYLSLSPDLRFHTNSGEMEKYLIRKAFSSDEYLESRNKALLPNEILFRRKEAFSDGVSKLNRSLFAIMKEFTYEHFLKNELVEHSYLAADLNNVYERCCKVDNQMKFTNDYLLPSNCEEYYYRKVFEKFYPKYSNIIPYFWMPKYVDAIDSSARTLKIYNN